MRRRQSAGVTCYTSLSFERKFFRILDCLYPQIDIEIGPIEMPRTLLFDIKYFSNRRFLEPGKIFIGHKELTITHKQPDAVT